MRKLVTSGGNPKGQNSNGQIREQNEFVVFYCIETKGKRAGVIKGLSQII